MYYAVTNYETKKGLGYVEANSLTTAAVKANNEWPDAELEIHPARPDVQKPGQKGF